MAASGVESEIDQGTTFFFTCVLGVRPVSEQSPDVSALTGIRVLVVDDNATNRQILSETLEKWGMDVVLAEGGVQGIGHLQQAEQSNQPISLVITDLHMPVMDGFDFSEKIRSLPGCEDTNIVMLTSGAGHSDAQRCKELRIDRHLMKPVKQSELLSAVFFALNLHHADWELSTPETAEEPQSIGSLNILLAEDGIANQKLAVAMLNRWGHKVTIANNGYEALDALANKPFDLVLMDVQMPEMDGLKATEEIRKKEKPTGRHIPIIAMTAHAMSGDREKCLCAGMDEYLSKPVRKAELYEALQTTIRTLGSKEVETAGPTNDTPLSAVNWDAAFAVVDGDRELLGDIATAAIEELQGLIERLIKAVDDLDAAGIQGTAHSIQGTLRVFQNVEASELVQKLEILGRENRLEEVPALLERLKCLLEQILTELNQFRRTPFVVPPSGGTDASP